MCYIIVEFYILLQLVIVSFNIAHSVVYVDTLLVVYSNSWISVYKNFVSQHHSLLA